MDKFKSFTKFKDDKKEIQINECTLVAGKNNKTNLFLFKNKDTSKLYDHEVIRDIVNGVEVAYYTNQDGWVEGLNEYGVGLVYAFFTSVDQGYDTFTTYQEVREPNRNEINPYFISHKGKFILEVISQKTLDGALNVLLKHGTAWNGNYYLGDSNRILDIEVYDKQIKYKEIIFDDDKKNDFQAKSNHGKQIPLAGHLDNGKTLRRADSEIRKGDATRYLHGFKTFNDIIKRMSFQEFDKNSPLNLFRTDSEEKTTFQMLLNLKHLRLDFIYYDKNAKFFGILSKLPKDYTAKITIKEWNRNDFFSSEMERFVKMRNNLYSDAKSGQDFVQEN